MNAGEPAMRILIGTAVCLFLSLERLPAADEIFAPGAKLKVEAERGVGGEGPAWHPKLGILTSGNGHVNQLDRDGKSRIYRKDAGTNGKGRGPDGLKQDQNGRLYVAAGLNKPNPPFEPAEDVKGGVYVLSPEGKLLTFLAVPRDEVTNCAFGGDDLKTLYITAGGTLYSTRTTTLGRLVWPEAN
jgi:hypothetical protein